MNTDIYNNVENVKTFLKKIIYQLDTYHSIAIDDVKILCYTLYKQSTEIENKEIQALLISAFGCINKDTKIYNNEKTQIKNLDTILNNLINIKIKNIFED